MAEETKDNNTNNNIETTTVKPDRTFTRRDMNNAVASENNKRDQKHEAELAKVTGALQEMQGMLLEDRAAHAQEIAEVRGQLQDMNNSSQADKFSVFAEANGLDSKSSNLFKGVVDLGNPDTWAASLEEYKDVLSPATPPAAKIGAFVGPNGKPEDQRPSIEGIPTPAEVQARYREDPAAGWKMALEARALKLGKR